MKLQIDDPEPLRWIMALGEGKVTGPERETILRLAAERGVEKTSPAHVQLEWLRARAAARPR